METTATQPRPQCPHCDSDRIHAPPDDAVAVCLGCHTTWLMGSEMKERVDEWYETDV